MNSDLERKKFPSGLIPLVAVFIILAYFMWKPTPRHSFDDYNDTQRERKVFLNTASHIRLWMTDHGMECASAMEVGEHFRHVMWKEGEEVTSFINPTVSSTANPFRVSEWLTFCPRNRPDDPLLSYNSEETKARLSGFPVATNSRGLEAVVSYYDEGGVFRANQTLRMSVHLCIQKYVHYFSRGFIDCALRDEL